MYFVRMYVCTLLFCLLLCGQKRASNPLELELGMVVSILVSAEN